MKLLNPYVMYKALKAKGIPLAFNSDSFHDQKGPVFDAVSKEERALLKLISLGEQFANSGSAHLRTQGEALLQALDDLNEAGVFDREKEINRSPLPVHPLEGGTLDLSLLEDGFPQDAVVIGQAFYDWYEGQGEQDAPYWFECRKQEGEIDVDTMNVDLSKPPKWNGDVLEMTVKPQ